MSQRQAKLARRVARKERRALAQDVLTTAAGLAVTSVRARPPLWPAFLWRRLVRFVLPRLPVR